VTRSLRFIVDHYLVLPAGGLIAVAWANMHAISYFRMAQSLSFLVNDIGMAFGIAYVAQEVIEAALPGGSLHPLRRAVVPIVAGIGGIVGAIVAYFAYVHYLNEDVLLRGWPIACAGDMFFCLAIGRSIFRRGAAVPFLLLTVLAGDIVSLTLVSRPHFAGATHAAAGVLIVCAIGLAMAFRRSGITSLSTYLGVPGLLSWFGCYWSGIHPALALLPILPFVPHSARDVNADEHVGRLRRHAANHFEMSWRYPVQVIAFLFGLVNAGVLLHGYDTGTWAVLAASLAGRPLGILAAVGIAATAGAQLPRTLGWKEIVTIALASTPVLTFGLFLAAAVFPVGPLLMETKIGAIGTAVGALLAFGAARLLRVGRFVSVAASRAPVVVEDGGIA
jgi:Na+:H+ antiporter, NhaA family